MNHNKMSINLNEGGASWDLPVFFMSLIAVIFLYLWLMILSAKRYKNFEYIIKFNIDVIPCFITKKHYI